MMARKGRIAGMLATDSIAHLPRLRIRGALCLWSRLRQGPPGDREAEEATVTHAFGSHALLKLCEASRGSSPGVRPTIDRIGRIRLSSVVKDVHSRRYSESWNRLRYLINSSHIQARAIRDLNGHCCYWIGLACRFAWGLRPRRAFRRPLAIAFPVHQNYA